MPAVAGPSGVKRDHAESTARNHHRRGRVGARDGHQHRRKKLKYRSHPPVAQYQSCLAGPDPCTLKRRHPLWDSDVIETQWKRFKHSSGLFASVNDKNGDGLRSRAVDDNDPSSEELADIENQVNGLETGNGSGYSEFGSSPSDDSSLKVISDGNQPSTSKIYYSNSDSNASESDSSDSDNESYSSDSDNESDSSDSDSDSKSNNRDAGESGASDTDSDDSVGDSDADSDEDVVEADSDDSFSEDEDVGYDEEEEDDDEEEDLACTDSCVCQGGGQRQIPPIERSNSRKVVKPLYKKLLQHLAMKPENRYAYSCCEWYCQDSWIRSTSHEVAQDYDDSDLSVQHFRWGSWKEKDPVCPNTCICNTGQRRLNIKPIKRNKKCRVEKPLYKRLLKQRLMRAFNRYSYPCCEERCNLYRWSWDSDRERRGRVRTSGRRVRDREDMGRPHHGDGPV